MNTSPAAFDVSNLGARCANAQLFVERLAGSDDLPVTLVAIGDGFSQVERGTIAALWPWVCRMQEAGRGVYFTVNQTAGKLRTKQDITRMRAVFLDVDAPATRRIETFPLEPHEVVETSPGKFHYYWFVDEAPDPFFEDLMKGMAAQYGADPSPVDISRVLRLPGTVNQKPGAGGHVAASVFCSARSRYTKAEILAAFPLASDTITGTRPAFDLSGAMSTIESGGEGLHDALRGFAAHFAARGVPGEVFGPMLTAFAEQHSDGSPRYRDRISEIPGLVKSAVAKFMQPETLDVSDPLDLFANGQAHAFGFNPADYPPAVAAYAADLSRRMGCDPLIPAWTMLVASAGLLPDRFKLQVKAYDVTWLESPRLWVALVGDPSSKKSPPMSAVLSAVERHQSRMARDHEAAMARWAEACAAAKKDKRAEPPAPHMPRLLANDATTEALALVLHTTPSGMLVVHDELSAFFGSMDAYRSNGLSKDRSFYLQAYNGAPFTVDRVKGAIFVPHLSLSIAGGIQPGPMREIASKLGEDGLLQRFIVLPTRSASSGVDEAADPAAAAGWSAVVEELVHVRECSTAWGDVYKLAPGAQQELDAGRRRLDALARNPAIDRRLSVALAKGEGQLARLVLVYHLLEDRTEEGLFGGREPSEYVAQATAAKAVRVFFDLVVPAQFDFYSRVIGETEHQQQCRRVAGYILAHGLETITERSLYKEALKEADERGRADTMRSLELSGWVAPIKEVKGRTTQWTVNPKVHAKFAVQAVAEQVRRSAVVADIRKGLK